MSTEFDLYEFPEGHVGRRTYVHVRGHSRSVPVVYTYRGSDGRNYIHPDFGGTWEGVENYSSAVQAPMFMRDIGEYTSVVDGTHISSRSQHREHVKRHGLVEVGNERIGSMTPAPATAASTAREVKRHLEQVKAMPEHVYKEHVQKQQQQVRAQNG